MGLRLQRSLGVISQLSPGQYTVETATARPALSCPACGGVSDLDEYRVLVGGLVSPIFSCPYQSCSFQSFLSLESYGEEVLK